MRWHDLADAATFAFYEPDGVAGGRGWAGGCGTDHAIGTRSLEVIGILPVGEISVDTALPNRRESVEQRHRVAAADLIWRLMLDESNEFQLPWTCSIVPDDRVVSVDGAPVEFSGLRIEGSPEWVGTAMHRGVVITFKAPEIASGLAIRTCTDWAELLDSPPHS